jgi:phage-related baseplate assembly protein
MGDLKFIETNAAEIYELVIGGLESGCSEDLYPGDERRIFGEAMVPLVVALFNSVNDACRQKMLRYARGEVLDAIGDTRGVTRTAAVPAESIVRFSVNSPISENVIIPKGTRVTADYTNYFATDTTAVLAAGESYVDISVTAETGGTSSNDIDEGMINVLVDSVPYIDSVSNISATSGGSDEEKDDAYRDRIRESGSTLSVAGPPNAYKYWAMEADATVADAVVESPSPGVVLITPICYGGEIPDDEILDKVLASCSADDIRPLTDQVKVQAPTARSYDIELKYYTTDADESACMETIQGTGGAIDKYIFWQGSALGRDINPDYLRKLILAPSWEDNLTGAVRVDVISPTFEDLEKTTVAKCSGNITVTHEITDSE